MIRTENLWSIFDEVFAEKEYNTTDYTVKKIINPWLTLKHYPEFHLERNYRKKQTFSYLKYVIEDNYDFIIPLTYITPSNLDSYNTSKIYWLKLSQEAMINDTLKRNFIIVNAEQMGKNKFIMHGCVH